MQNDITQIDKHPFIKHGEQILACTVDFYGSKESPEAIGITLRTHKGVFIGDGYSSFCDIKHKCDGLPKETVKEMEAFSKSKNRNGMYLEEIKIKDEFRDQGYGEILRNMMLYTMSKVDSDYSFFTASPLTSELSLDKLISFYQAGGYEVLYRHPQYDTAVMFMKDKSQMNIGTINFVDEPVDMNEIHARIEAKRTSNNKLSLLEKTKNFFK